MRETFKTWYPFELKQEGGWSNHPSDPGGVTLNGVIQKVYDAWRRKKGLTPRPLTKAMEPTAEWKTEREQIYRENYWDLAQCDDLPTGVDFVVGDAAVNSGVGQSTKWLQRALGKRYTSLGGTVDGSPGALTVAAAKSLTTRESLLAAIDSMCDQRLAMLKNLKTWPVFGKGWGRRVEDVRRTAKQLVTTGAALVPEPAPTPAAADEVADKMAKAPVSSTSASSVIVSKEGALASIPVIGSALSAAANPGPLAYAVAFAIVVVVVVGLFWFIKEKRGQAS